MNARRAVVVAIVVVNTIAAAEAHAFKCTRAGDAGPSLFWTNRTVTLQRSGEGQEVKASDIERVMQASAQAWTDIDCSDVAEQIGLPTDDRVVGFDWSTGVGSPENHNIVVFRNDDPSDPLDTWTHDLGAIAITTVTFESNEGRLLDADVEVNDANFAFTACDACDIHFDLQNTLTHEFGHVLGLDHATDGDATMFPSAPEGDTTKRSLGDDDTQAICTVYPQGDATAGNCYPESPRTKPPRVRFEPTLCGAGGSSAPVATFALLLGACALVRARTKARRRRP